jgi:hypothetical protein
MERGAKSAQSLRSLNALAQIVSYFKDKGTANAPVNALEGILPILELLT